MGLGSRYTQPVTGTGLELGQPRTEPPVVPTGEDPGTPSVCTACLAPTRSIHHGRLSQRRRTVHVLFVCKMAIASVLKGERYIFPGAFGHSLGAGKQAGSIPSDVGTYYINKYIYRRPSAKAPQKESVGGSGWQRSTANQKRPSTCPRVPRPGINRWQLTGPGRPQTRTDGDGQGQGQGQPAGKRSGREPAPTPGTAQARPRLPLSQCPYRTVPWPATHRDPMPDR